MRPEIHYTSRSPGCALAPQLASSLCRDQHELYASSDVSGKNYVTSAGVSTKNYSLHNSLIMCTTLRNACGIRYLQTSCGVAIEGTQNKGLRNVGAE